MTYHVQFLLLVRQPLFDRAALPLTQTSWVLPPLSVGKMTLRLYSALNYSHGLSKGPSFGTGRDRERPSVVKSVYGRDTLLLLIALREEDDCRRRQVQDVGSEIRRYVAALLSRTMTAFPVPDGRDSTLQDSPQTGELALQVVRNEISLEEYSCVDPPPPSTLISRGEVSHRCWHRGPRLNQEPPVDESRAEFGSRRSAPWPSSLGTGDVGSNQSGPMMAGCRW